MFPTSRTAAFLIFALVVALGVSLFPFGQYWLPEGATPVVPEQILVPAPTTSVPASPATFTLPVTGEKAQVSIDPNQSTNWILGQHALFSNIFRRSVAITDGMRDESLHCQVFVEQEHLRLNAIEFGAPEAIPTESTVTVTQLPALYVEAQPDAAKAWGTDRCLRSIGAACRLDADKPSFCSVFHP